MSKHKTAAKTDTRTQATHQARLHDNDPVQPNGGNPDHEPHTPSERMEAFIANMKTQMEANAPISPAMIKELEDIVHGGS